MSDSDGPDDTTEDAVAGAPPARAAKSELFAALGHLRNAAKLLVDAADPAVRAVASEAEKSLAKIGAEAGDALKQVGQEAGDAWKQIGDEAEPVAKRVGDELAKLTRSVVGAVDGVARRGAAKPEPSEDAGDDDEPTKSR